MIGYLKAGLLCTCFALFLNVIPAAIPYWWKDTREGVTRHIDGNFTETIVANSTNSIYFQTIVVNYGVFTACVKEEGSQNECSSYADPPTWMTITFILLFVAIGVLTISAVLSVLFINVFTHIKAICVVAALFAILGGCADIASLTVFGMNANNYFRCGSYYVAFGVPVTSIVFAFISAILQFCYRNAEHKVV